VQQIWLLDYSSGSKAEAAKRHLRNPRARSSGASNAQQRNLSVQSEQTDTLMTSDQSLQLMRWKMRSRRMPALLTRMSMRPKARTLHRADGWTPQTLAAQLKGAFAASFTPLERSPDVFSWDPI
jgi:hypothetical protein